MIGIDMDRTGKRCVEQSLGESIKNDPYDYGFGDLLTCPVCGDGYSHISYDEIQVMDSDHYNAWNGRGPCTVIPIEGECSHGWDICIGYHKGENFIFVSNIRR